MAGMDDAFRTIPIHDAYPALAAQAVPACGGCLHDAARGPVCRAMPDQAWQAPQLSGPAD